MALNTMISALEPLNTFVLECPGNPPGDPTGPYPEQMLAAMPDGLTLPSMTHCTARSGSVDLANGRQVYPLGGTVVPPCLVVVSLGSYRLIQNREEKRGKRKICPEIDLLPRTREIPLFPLENVSV